MRHELPPHLEKKLAALGPDAPRPVFKEWAEKHGTPWLVSFPKTGTAPAKRRFFRDAETATEEVVKWSKGRKPEAVLGKRVVDEVNYARELLPPGVSLIECVRFYLAHNPTNSKVSLKTVVDALRLDLKRKSKSYCASVGYTLDHIEKGLGTDTLMVHLTKGTLLKFIREPEGYWDRFNRKRAVSLLMTKAVEMEAIPNNPLQGVKRIIEKEPKKEVHALSVRDAQIILD